MNNAISKMTFSIWLMGLLFWFYMFPQAGPFDNVVIMIGLYFLKKSLEKHWVNL